MKLASLETIDAPNGEGGLASAGSLFPFEVNAPQPSARLKVVLSLFPGIGLLDRGFEETGFTVMRGPDPLWGGDVRKFHPPRDLFCGIIGGPPCQRFSLANRSRNVTPTAEDMELVNEFLRCICDAAPRWWLMENVPGSPSVTVPGYTVQRFTLDASHVGSEQRRLRKFHFGYLPGLSPLVIKRDRTVSHLERTCIASEARRGNRREWKKFCALQGLPDGFDLEPFTIEAKFRAVGNGVPFAVALALAQAVADSDRSVTPRRLCECGCGQFVTGKERTAGIACRKREQRRRDAEKPKKKLQTNLVLQYELPAKLP